MISEGVRVWVWGFGEREEERLIWMIAVKKLHCKRNHNSEGTSETFFCFIKLLIDKITNEK